jgi:hypothetical protein
MENGRNFKTQKGDGMGPMIIPSQPPPRPSIVVLRVRSLERYTLGHGGK